VATKCAIGVSATPAANKAPAPVVEAGNDNGGVSAPSADTADDEMPGDAAVAAEYVETK